MADLDNFEAFMRHHQDMVFTVAVRLVSNEADAEDIAQTAFLKAYEHFDELAENPAAGAWLRTVATNLALNHLTRYRARWRFFSELSDEGSGASFIDLQPAPDSLQARLDKTDERRLLEAALQKLPDAQRVPLVLYHFEDLTYEDIAARLHISLAKVKTDIHRGRETLRRVILGHFRNLVEPDADARSIDARPDGEPPRQTRRTGLLPRAARRFAERFKGAFTDHALRFTPPSHAL